MRSRRPFFVPALLLVSSVFTINCEQSPRTLCDQAAQHISECTGQPLSWPTAECDHEQANRALASDCEAFSTSAAGKADFNPLCLPLLLSFKSFGRDESCCFDHNCKGDDVCLGGRCKPKLEEGGSCRKTSHCQKGLLCLDGKCEPPRAENKPCTKRFDCKSPLVCGVDNFCTRRSRNGLRCSENDHCTYTCINGTCSRWSELGGACDPGDVQDCESPRYDCVDMVCRRPPEVEAGCDRENDRFACGYRFTCWNKKCEPKHGLGEPCEDLHDCDKLFCNDGVCGPLQSL